MSLIFAANFKTNHTRKSTAEYLEKFSSFLEGRSEKGYVFPPATALTESVKNVTVGTQNPYPARSGSFTGEIGLDQLEEFECKTVLIGHSERRHVLGETLEQVREKYNFYKEQGYEIFFCIGEPLEVKEEGVDAVMGYIADQVEGIDLNYDKLVIAYEPVWAIGTGKSATAEDIADIHTRIKKLSDKPLLYGGSVKVANINEIAKIDNVDGVLVGTASWNVDDFCKMIEEA
ncbi:MAG: triose-phosphate isomerase [Campylobacterales bacterium]|nr:triose-phosphate isomerase [Campylobacterales bacterium]